METWERELLTSRIIAGEYERRFGSSKLLIKQISRKQKYQANQIYKSVFDEARLMDIMTQEDALDLLKHRKLWDDKKQEELDEHYKNLEENKVKIYETWGEENVTFFLKNNLAECKRRLADLEEQKSKFDYMTAESIGLAAKYRYIIGSSIWLSENSPYWDSIDCWEQPDSFIESVMEDVAYNRLSETQFRELSRTEPWSSYWSASKHSGRGLFDCASVDLSDEQKILISWSGVYESVRNHPEAPEDSVFNDDDAFDGWLIIKRRQAKEEATKGRLDSLGSKIKNSDEVFVMAKSVEDVAIIDAQNKKAAKAIKEQRLREIKQKGEVPEECMSSTVREQNMKLQQMYVERGR